MDEDLEMEVDGTEPALGTLAARYPDLANMAPGDVLRELTARQFANIEQQRAAREKAAASKAALFKEGQAEIKKRRYGAPTTREQLFALGAALTSPRYYGGLAGTMSRVAPVLGEMSQLQSNAQSQRDEAMRQLRMQYGIDTEAAEIGALEAEGAALKPLISTYGTLAKPKPLQNVGMEVVNGKLVVVRTDPSTGELIKDEIGDAPADMIPVPGVTAQGQPVFRGARGITTATGEPVTQFDPKETKPGKPRAPSSTEMRQIIQTEDRLNGRLSGLRAVQDALGLNQQAYEGSLAGGRAALGRLFSSDDPAYVATEQLEQLVKTGALADLKATFGGNPTEGERKALLELQANITKPRAVRERFLRRLLQEIQIATDNERKRLEDLKTGKYGQYQQPSAPAPARGQPRVIRYDKEGNRI
jgi:hypothetical protein